MNKKLIVGCISVFLIVACSKDKTTNNIAESSCNSNDITTQLFASNQNLNKQLFTESLSEIDIQATESDGVLCNATLSLGSLLDNNKQIKLPIRYKVKKQNNNTQVTNVSISPSEQNVSSEWAKWARQMNSQLVEYKVLDRGVLFVKQDNNVSQSLNYNGNEVLSNLVNNDSVKIEREFKLNGQAVFLIGNYSGGTIDNTSKNNYLITINSDNKVILTESFAYKGEIVQKDNSLFLKLYDPEQVYADNQEMPTIEYKDGVFVNLNADTLAPKYEGLSAKKIIEMATKDGCYDPKYQVFDLSNACDQALKYCKLFKSLNNPPHDQYYNILKETCQ